MTGKREQRETESEGVREVDGFKDRQLAGLRDGGQKETEALCCHQDISYITVTLDRLMLCHNVPSFPSVLTFAV